MAINAGSVFVDLGAKLDRREFDAYEKELKKVQDRTAKRERFKAELGANFDSRAFGAYERELKKADRANDNMVRSNGRLHTSFGNVWSKGGAAFAAAGGAVAVVAAVKSVVGAYGDAEASAKRVQTAVDNAGISYDAHAKQIDKVIQAQSKLSKFDDEDLADSFARFVTQTKNVNEALRLNALAADVARGRQISLDAAQRLVARASQGNVGALKRLGIEIDPVTKATDKLKDSTDKVSESTKNQAKQHDLVSTKQRAVAALQEKFGGQSKAYGKTQQGAIDGLSVAWENLREKLGAKLAPTITDVAGKASKFIDEMTTGKGEGGKFARTLERDVWPALKQVGDALRVGGRLVGRFFDDFNSNERQVGGWVSGFGRAESAVLKFTGKLVGGEAGDKLREWGKNVDRNADKVDRWRQELKITREVDKIEDDLDRLKNKTNGTLHGILVATHRNMDNIRDTMGDESAAGQRALHRNFQAAVTAIRTAMRQGNISTKTGLAQIRREMQQELRTLGIASAERGGLPLSKNPPKGDLPVTTNSAPITKYGGGWIGAPGMVGADSVPAMLAPGEAVLNRHQQAVIEGMLGGGFLDRLFASVQRPHYMDRGGRIPFAAGGVTPAISSLIEELDSKGFHHGSTTGPGHAPGGFHPRGMAVDYGDASNDMQTLWGVVFPQRKRFAELFGPTRVTPGPHLMHNGAGFQNAALQADHQDHIHMALAAAIGALGGTAGSALGAAWKALKAPQTTISGLLGDVVQGTLDRTTSLANKRGRSLAKTAPGAGPDLSGGPGGGSNSANRALGRSMAAAMGWTGGQFSALDSLWQGESGWSNTARNPSSGAFGIPQALPASKMGPAGAGGNARAQIAWGLNYIKGRYGSPSGAYSAWLSRSPHWYAKGGKVDKLKRTVGGSTAGLIRKIRPVQTDRSSRYDALMASVERGEDNYSRWESRFNITDEELVDADTGQINTRAIKRKAKELTQLIFIRIGIEQDLERAQQTAKAIVASYRKVVAALRKSLTHAKGKNRKGIRSYINQYQPRITEWQGKIADISGSRFEAKTDELSLRAELRDVLGTTPEIQAPDTAIDTSTGADTFAADSGGTDTTTAAPTPLQIAEGAAAEMRTFLAGRQDLLSSFGRNYVPQGSAAAVFGAPDPLTAAAGVRAFGGASAGGLGGATIIANFASSPDNAPTFVQQIRFIAEGG